MTSLKEHILNPRRAAAIIVGQYFTWLPDKLFLKVLFRLKMGYRLDLRNPQTFSEKLQWLKLYNRKPEYTMMVDKASVKDYVASIIGKEYIIPTLGVWERPEDIEWDTLPDKFVLKTTHGGGSSGVLICKNKSTLDRKKAIESLNRTMKMDIYKELKEWPYKNVHKRIIAEQYIEPRPDVKDLPDYKFFCFNGEPKYCQVISGRETNECIDFFDHEWNHMPFHEPKDYSFANPLPCKPIHYEQMWQAARQLAKGLPFSRIDFYEMEDHSLFGEITLFPTSGMGGFDPQEYDFDFGKMIDIQGL